MMGVVLGRVLGLENRLVLVHHRERMGRAPTRHDAEWQAGVVGDPQVWIDVSVDGVL